MLADVDVTGIMTPVRSEILCFMHDKSSIMPFDDVVKLCVDFYREEEIIGARSLLESAGHKMHKRKGADKLRSTVEDLLKMVVDPHAILPTFYAVDLARLPPVDVSHCDMSAVLLELRSNVMNCEA